MCMNYNIVDIFSQTSVFAACFPDNVQMGRPRLGVRVRYRSYGVLSKNRTLKTRSHSALFFPYCILYVASHASHKRLRFERNNDCLERGCTHSVSNGRNFGQNTRLRETCGLPSYRSRSLTEGYAIETLVRSPVYIYHPTLAVILAATSANRQVLLHGIAQNAQIIYHLPGQAPSG